MGSSPVNRKWVTGFALAQMGVWLALYAPLKTLLPVLATELGGNTGFGKEGLLAAATLLGSLVALVANPLAGVLSDQTNTRWGARAPWIVAGVILAAGSIGLMPSAKSGAMLVMLWCLTKIGINSCMAALNGAAADQVPEQQMGRVWGWVGLSQPIGLVVGVVISAQMLPDIQHATTSQIILLAACCMPFLLVHENKRRKRNQQIKRTKALSVFSNRNFRRIWWSRFWLYLGWSMGTVYLLYFLEDRLSLSRSDALSAQSILLALYAGGTVASAAIAGWLSDRYRNRIAFITIGSLGMAAAYGIMLKSQTLELALYGSSLLGIAYGIYIPTHQALLMEHLPNPEHHARDLGMFNGANTAPMVIAPAMAWMCLVHLGGYTTLFGTASLMIACSLLPIIKISESTR
jgi:MFS family permease